MDGRVKTLHPSVHGGLLAVRNDPEHVAAMEAHGIGGIDLAVINLYPFEEVRFKGGDYDTTVENIDIGGPAMIRASAKNHAYVATVVDPADYADVVAELEKNEGSLPISFRKSSQPRRSHVLPLMMQPFQTGLPKQSVRKPRPIARLQASCTLSCAMVKTHIRRLVLSDRRTASGCGHSNAASGQAAFL